MKKSADNIRLIVCDVDNTIIPSREEAMSRRLAEDFHKAMDQGIHVIVNTGRHYTFLQESLFDDLPMDLTGTINGACITDREGKALEKYPMTEDQMKAITMLCLTNNVGLGFKFEDHIVTYANHEKFIRGYLDENRTFEDQIINDSMRQRHHLTHGCPLGTFLVGGKNIVRPFVEVIPELQFAWSYRGGFDVFLQSVDKSLTVEAALKKYGLTWENVIAFGDAGNDTPFVEKAAIRVAMGNSKDDLKEKADIIADDCRKDGVAKVLEDLKIV